MVYPPGTVNRVIRAGSLELRLVLTGTNCVETSDDLSDVVTLRKLLLHVLLPEGHHARQLSDDGLRRLVGDHAAEGGVELLLLLLLLSVTVVGLDGD